MGIMSYYVSFGCAAGRASVRAYVVMNCGSCELRRPHPGRLCLVFRTACGIRHCAESASWRVFAATLSLPFLPSSWNTYGLAPVQAIMASYT